MNRDQAVEFAARWADAWNRRDVEALLEHFANDVEFFSPKAAAITGKSRVRGKEALRAYFEAALERITENRFEVEHVVWDEAASTLVVVYRYLLDGERGRACEVMLLGENGRIFIGEALYGVLE